MLDVIAAAMANMAVKDNWEGVSRLFALTTDPGAASDAMGVPVREFVEWRAGTSKGGDSGYISEGGQFRREKPTGADDHVQGDEHAKAADGVADAVGKSLQNDPEVKANPGLGEKVTNVAVAAAAHVLLAVQRIQDHWTGKAIAELVDAYFDSPNDMKKLGYNPGNSSGTSNPRVADPVSNAIQDAVGFGMSGHLVAKIAAEVLSRGFLFLRNKFRGAAQTQGMADGDPMELAKTLADIFNQFNQSMGLDGVNSPEDIAAAIATLKGSDPKKA